MLRLLLRAPKRFLNSFLYVWSGLKSIWREDSFKLEVLAFFVLSIVLALSPWPTWKILIMIATYLLIPLVELLNTAIEDVCNHITTDYSVNIKNAKDKGAAAVLFAIIINALVLLALIFV